MDKQGAIDVWQEAPPQGNTTFKGVNSDIEAEYLRRIAPPPPPTPRERIESLDLRDVDAIREQMRADAAARGRPIKGGSLAAVNAIESAQRKDALAGMQLNDKYAIDARNVARQERATDSLIKQGEATMANKNVPDSVKQQISIATSLASDMRPEIRDQGIRDLAVIQLGLLQEAEAKEMARRGVAAPIPPIGGYAIDIEAPTIDGYSEGGEVDVEYEVEMDMPEAVPTGPVQMDSGDYVIPVEAMRFYGRKFFQELINKAEDSE
jgi:hypothetical protein